jgi:hypothetical protein
MLSIFKVDRLVCMAIDGAILYWTGIFLGGIHSGFLISGFSWGLEVTVSLFD